VTPTASRARSSAISKGFVIWSSAPARSASTMSPVSPLDVNHGVGSLWSARSTLRAPYEVVVCSCPTPNVLTALVAFVAEHQRCGDLDGGRDDARVWLACSCGAQIVHPAAPPPAAVAGDSHT
jgi:hypothetical protein